MGELAANGAASIGYRNAGTMEFLFDQDGSFYFMEMNTRIQVEHPVTEEVTGIDLVKEQILVAAGEPMSLTQDDVEAGTATRSSAASTPRTSSTTSGPAPARSRTGTSPAVPGCASTATCTRATRSRRYYDSMIGKLIAHGKDRAEALRRMEIALEEMIVEGIKTTIPFHRLALASEKFRRVT